MTRGTTQRPYTNDTPAISTCPGEHDPFPVRIGAPPLGIAFRKELLRPSVVRDLSRESCQFAFDQVVGIAVVDDRPLPHVTQVELRGQDHLLVVGMMERVLVMFGMACPEVVMAMPPQEGIDAEEEPVEPAGPEDGIVDQFVKPVYQEMPEMPVDEHEQEGYVPGPVEGRVDGDSGPRGEYGEIAQCLDESEEIAASVQAGQLLTSQAASVPLHARLRERRVVLGPLGQHFFVGQRGGVRTDDFGLSGLTGSFGVLGRSAHGFVLPERCGRRHG